MILNKEEIKQALDTSELIINPPPRDSQFQPASLDICLGNKYINPHYGSIDVKQKPIELPLNKMDNGEITLWPGNFLLFETLEEITVPKTMCVECQGRSSIGRIGLTIHVTAGFIDPGYHGKLTLEVKNLSQNIITLHSGMRIAQLIFHRINPATEYAGKYQGITQVQTSKIYEDEEMIQYE